MVSKQVGGPDNIHFSLCVDKLWGTVDAAQLQT